MRLERNRRLWQRRHNSAALKSRYKNALGGFWVVLLLSACYVLTEVLRVSSSTWLSHWTHESALVNYGPGFYNMIYTALSFGQGIEMYGLGNWTEVAEHVGIESKEACIDHYRSVYLNSPFFPLPDMSHVVGKNRKELLAMEIT